MSRRRQTPCPTPSKLAYDSQGHAAESLLEEFARHGRAGALWGYRCICGRWHRTSHRYTGQGRVRPDQVLLLTQQEQDRAQAAHYGAQFEAALVERWLEGTE